MTGSLLFQEVNMHTIVIYILCGLAALLDIGFILYLLNEEYFFTDDIRGWARKKIQSYYGRESNTLLEEDQNGD